MPVRLSVRISPQARVVRQGLQNLRAEVPKIGAARIVEALTRAKARITRYPSPPSGSRYIRTYTYKSAWQIVRASASGWRLVGEAVGPRGEYTRYVGGNAYGTGQARVHVGRFVTVRDAVDAEVQKLPKTIREHILMVARREGL